MGNLNRKQQKILKKFNKVFGITEKNKKYDSKLVNGIVIPTWAGVIEYVAKHSGGGDGGYQPDFTTIGLTSNNTLGVIDYISATQVESIRQVLVDAINNKADESDLEALESDLEALESDLETLESDLTTETTARESADTNLQTQITAIQPVITEITAHQTINTYEVPTLTTTQVTNLYNSVVAGRTTIIHFDPSDLGIDTDYVITQASNVTGIAIRFIYNDTMILTYTISGDSVVISYKDIGGGGEQPHLYLHTINLQFSVRSIFYEAQLSFLTNIGENIDNITKLVEMLTKHNYKTGGNLLGQDNPLGWIKFTDDDIFQCVISHFQLQKTNVGEYEFYNCYINYIKNNKNSVITIPYTTQIIMNEYNIAQIF